MKKTGLTELVELMEYMRGEKGCLWDREQKLEDFLVHLKNESDEVLQAIGKNDSENLREELGDLLWNIIFISQIAREKGEFDIYDVMEDVKKKIIRRHPHVFGCVKANTVDEVKAAYMKVKEREKLLSPKPEKEDDGN